MRGIGALTVYDISHRISAHFRKGPELVYLHAGTRVGARVFNIRGDSFDPRVLPKAFSRLAPYEIEDCLCIYGSAQESVKVLNWRGFLKPAVSGFTGCVGDHCATQKFHPTGIS
jgi:hypothetical protein